MVHVRVHTPLVVVATALLALSACGGSSDDADTKAASTTTAAPGTSTSTGATTPAFIDIETCEATGGTGTSSGTIENQGESAAAYDLEIGFYDAANTLLGSGSFETETTGPGESAEWTVNASGISEAEPECHTVSVAAHGGGSNTPTTAASGADLEFPCDLIDLATMGQLAGNPLDPGSAVTNQVDENNVKWTAHACAWSKRGTDEATEVTIAVSHAADFPAGAVACPTLKPSEAISGIGTSAQWSFNDPGITLKVGDLRVCTDDALVGVTVSGTTSEADQLKIAHAVAQKTLAGL